MTKLFPSKQLNILITIILLTYTSLSAQENKLNSLIHIIENSSKYDKEKKAEIDSIRTILKKTKKSDLLSLYHLNTEMFYRFKVFQRDSAFYYGIQAKDLAYQLNNKSFIANANMNLADICVSSGMYKEALDFLEPSKIDEKNSNYNALYYGVLGRCYGDMAEYSNTPYFNKQYLDLAHTYREKALSLTEDGYFFSLFLKSI
jgi:tetratricopeptide (TPR) repeat protein